MPDITQCPDCQRKLSLPDGQLGQTVRCPACGAEFEAQLYVAPRQEAAPEAVSPEPSPEPPRGRDYPDRDDDRRDYDDRPRRRPRRRYYGGSGYERPHRGGTIQALGIVSICTGLIPGLCIAAWITGGIALGMASTDLAAMDNGYMDASGRRQTMAGRTCAIVGFCLSGLVLLSCCGIGILGNLMNR